MGGKSAPTTQSVTKQELSPEQQQLANLAMPYLTQYASNPIELYQGNTVAGFTPEQVQAQEGYKAAVPGINNLGQQAAASQSFMLGTGQLDPNSNPFISSIADQITGKIQSGLVEKTLPVIRGTSIGAGGMYGGGSTRGQLAEGGAVTGAAEATGDALTNLYFQNYQSGLNNIARAQQLNPNIMAQQLFGSDVLGAVGEQKRAMEQALLAQEAQRFQLQQALPYIQGSEILGLLSGLPGGQTTTTNTGATPKTNPIMGGLGGAASGAAIGSIIPGVGTAMGAVLGGLAGAGSSFL